MQDVIRRLLEASTSTDCRSETGVTVGLIDGVIAQMRILAKRDLKSPEVVEALKDFVDDEDLCTVMNSLHPHSH